MTDTTLDPAGRARPTSSLPALGLSALGVVFGDIGTSPLYTLKTVLDVTGDHPAPATTLGALSLVVWTLIIITSVKYVSFAMRVDNDGEGGILALMSLLGVKRRHRPVIIAIGLLGAALIYGDGAITPAISVLSALEGLEIATPAFHPYILPASVVILVALFAVQPQGTARIGRAFGPVMALWFVVIALLGLGGIWQHPAVLAGDRSALRPRLSVLGRHYRVPGARRRVPVRHRRRGALCRHGPFRRAADPPRLVGAGVAGLVLNYAGQAALVLARRADRGNIFYRLCPPARC